MVFADFFELKAKVYKELEEARNNKVIGSSLEAEVKLNLSDKYDNVKDLLGKYLHQLLIVSKITYSKDGKEVKVVKHQGQKCERCWNYVDHIEDGICDRCREVISK